MHEGHSAPRPTDAGMVPLTVTAAGLTDTGALRATNEDSIAVMMPEDLERLRERGVLAMVADGMGGHAGGEVASGVATARLVEAYFAASGSPQECLLHAFELANREIYDRARRSPELSGMGTTCTAVAV